MPRLLALIMVLAILNGWGMRPADAAEPIPGPGPTDPAPKPTDPRPGPTDPTRPQPTPPLPSPMPPGPPK
jgi:hypothetical protein